MQTMKIADMTNKELVGYYLEIGITINNTHWEESMSNIGPYIRLVDLRGEIQKEILRRMEK